MVIPLYCGCTLSTPSASISFFVAPSLIGPKDALGTSSICGPVAAADSLAIGIAADVVAGGAALVAAGAALVAAGLFVDAAVEAGGSGGLSHATTMTDRHATARRRG